MTLKRKIFLTIFISHILFWFSVTCVSIGLLYGGFCVNWPVLYQYIVDLIGKFGLIMSFALPIFFAMIRGIVLLFQEIWSHDELSEEEV